MNKARILELLRFYGDYKTESGDVPDEEKYVEDAINDVRRHLRSGKSDDDIKLDYLASATANLNYRTDFKKDTSFAKILFTNSITLCSDLVKY